MTSLHFRFQDISHSRLGVPREISKTKGNKNPSLSNMGEGFINFGSFLFAPISSINKTTAVWASQSRIRVYYGYIGPFFRNFLREIS